MIKDPKDITMKMGDTGYLVVNGKIEQVENGWYHSAYESLFKCNEDCRQDAIKKLG